MNHPFIGGLIVWFSFGAFAAIAGKMMGVEEDWFWCIVKGFGGVSLVTATGALMFFGLWLAGVPL
jgi:hypothetical protein